MKSNFVIISSLIKYIYRRYQKPFLFKNAFYRYLRVNYYNKKNINVSIIKSLILTSESHLLSTNSTYESSKDFVIKDANNFSKIVYLINIDRSIAKYIFREFHYVIAIIQFFLLEILYDLYFNTRYIISLINRAFL